MVSYYHNMLLREGNRQAMIDRINQLELYDTEKLKTITIPVLIMWGNDDKWIPVSAAKKFDSFLINSRVVIYKNAGHVPMEELPNLTLLDFIKFID